jgi:hypothetical protein
MRRLSFIIIALLACIGNSYAEDKLQVEDFTINPGGTATLNLLLSNPDAEYTAIQVDLYLPDGIDLVTENEDYKYSLSRVAESHSLSIGKNTGFYRLILSSSKSEVLSGTSGKVISLTVKADANLSEGAKNGSLKDIKLAKVDGTGLVIEQAAYSVTVTQLNVTAPEGKTNLVYSGNAQDLMTAGSTSDGEMQYSLDDTNYGTAIPQGTDAKEYTVYYKVVDNLGQNLVEPVSFNVTIASKMVSSPTITLSETSYTYDGNAKEPTVTVKDGETTIPSSEYTVSYANNINVGTATVTITDKDGGNYNVSGSATFSITGTEPVSETTPIAIGKSGKASYCGDKSLDFSFSEEVKAYIATGFDKDEGIIWLTRVKDVPAGVPVLIKGKANETYQVPVTDSENSYYKNMFVGNTTGETIQVGETDGDKVNYYLSGDGTFKSVNKSVNIGNNKSYLQLPGTFNPAVAGATQTVTVGASGKASYAAPVDLDFTNVEGLKAFSATGYDKSSKTIWLTRVMKVQKGEGVLLKGDAKDYQIPSTSVQSSYMNMFVGNTSGVKKQVQETSEDGSQTNFYLNGDGSFVSVNGYVNIGNNKCYLELPTSMVAVASTRGAEANYILDEPEIIKLPISFRSIDNDGDGTTGIKDQSSKFNAPSDNAYYTLQSQRVEKPGKGLYIKNGKKIVIK